MGFSIRDGHGPLKIIGNQSGQGIIEYVLVLVVSVALILGGVYQLNNAFKSFANNYFGNYLSCLLETGDLPSISGSPGDSGICAQQFEPFKLADGWKLKPNGPGSGGKGGGAAGGSGNGGATGATAESNRGNSGYFPSSGSFRAGRSSNSAGAAKARTKLKGGSATDTGSTAVSNYGEGYTPLNKKIDKSVRYRLDNRFAFQDEKEAEVRRKVAGSAKSEDVSRRSPRMKLKERIQLKADNGPATDSELTFGDYLRYLIIFGILIALFVLLGGQSLSIGKSME